MISVCRKPLSEKTIAANVLKWGTGGINIDESRVEGESTHGSDKASKANGTMSVFNDKPSRGVPNAIETKGRWPANLIHDGSDEVVEGFPQTGVSKGGNSRNINNSIYGQYKDTKNNAGCGFNDEGSAARFFYCAKASKSERGEGNSHPTVKPLKLMQYLTKLVTPPLGTVLDPFMGSGTTGIACVKNDFDFVGIEIDPDYIEIARSRIKDINGCN